MGWGDCGDDSTGRPIGYVHGGTCDHEGCKVEIDRGLSYVCGDMHGEDEFSCEKYFCEAHKKTVEFKTGECLGVCFACAKFAEEQGLLINEEEDEESDETE